MCLTAFARFGAGPPRSVLDLGCGTAMNLERLARTVPDCWGVDVQEVSVAYARSVRPRLTLRVGDMRSGPARPRLRRGHVLRQRAVVRAHRRRPRARRGDVRRPRPRRRASPIADVLNARSYLEGAFQDRVESAVAVPGFAATSVSTLALDRERRILTRRRVWHIPGRPGRGGPRAVPAALPGRVPRPGHRRRLRGAGAPRQPRVPGVGPDGPGRSRSRTWPGCVGAKLYLVAARRAAGGRRPSRVAEVGVDQLHLCTSSLRALSSSSRAAARRSA